MKNSSEDSKKDQSDEGENLRDEKLKEIIERRGYLLVVQQAFEKAVADQLTLKKYAEEFSKRMAPLQPTIAKIAVEMQERADALNRSGILERIHEASLFASRIAADMNETQGHYISAKNITIPVVKPTSDHYSKQVEDDDEKTHLIEDTVVEVLNKLERKGKGQGNLEIFINSKNKTISRVPRDIFSFDFNGPAQKQFKILEFLANERDFVETDNLKIAVGKYKNNQSLYKAIQNINRKLKAGLGLKDPIIFGRRTSGYRINPVYKIKEI